MEDFHFETIRESNQREIELNADCQRSITGMKRIEEFISCFSSLPGAGDIRLYAGNLSFSPATAYYSFELTLGSIISCCKSYCMADAFSLLRKYNDDLFFFLYIVAYNYNTSFYNENDGDIIKKHLTNWSENKLDKLNIKTVLKTISKAPQVSEAIKKYSLEDYFTNLSEKLNNYVHTKGYSFYNYPINAYNHDRISSYLLEVYKDMCFITVTFIFLLTLVHPLSIMSSDYIDCMDCDLTPPIDSQYWVAPFVTDFLKDNLQLIDSSCIEYLRDNTNMML